jgi:hypothetical protein
VSDVADIENQAGLARVTCGWKKPHLRLDFVRRYWRDAHSPAIARRDGLWEYRHSQFDAVRGDLLPPVEGIAYDCDPAAQLMWLSDVRYRDEAAMDAFSRSPGPEVRAQILADIELIVDKSTTYKVIGRNGRTLVDTTGKPAPLGPVSSPSFSLFFRQRGEEAPFREAVTQIAEIWAATPGMRRVRLALFEVPDMEAERKAGYPVKTHPAEQQYQAWIDLVIDSQDVAASLGPRKGADWAAEIAAIHAYPTVSVYTFNHGGRPTLAGLRGFAACEAIKSLGAEHQKDPGLLEWMYGAPAEGRAPA